MMELTKDESKRILRRIELEAYSALVTALRAQGELDRRKKRLLRELGEQLSISTERHRAEIRRAISDDRLSMIAECICGSDASVEWESEGRRVVPLMPRLVPQTAFTGSATAAANHAASVNSTIPSTTKGTLKDDDEECRSRKRQRTSSPGTVQKVIVSCATKTATARNNTATKDSSRFVKATTVPVKQDTSQLPSMKMTSSGSGSSKPTVLPGSKSSSVSVAPSKYIAPLPASCLQAHASVVSGNKNRMNLNIVKTKPAKAKIKTMAASVKIKSASTGTSAVPSVVHTVAQSLLSMAKTKGTGKEVANSPSKTVHVTRSTSTISVAPRSSISLTTFKPSIQPKPTNQSSLTTVRNVEAISRQNPTQHGKAVSVSRRPLPAILPKTIPPKSLAAVSSPGRKLASILPAPVKSTSSSLPNSLLVPVVVSSSSTPIPIAPSPHPPQTFTPASTNSIMNKVTTVSIATGQSSNLKRDTQDTSLVSSEAKSPVLLGKSPSGSQGSSPMSSKSLDNIHERETLSPVNEILTLVTSPSSVPYVPSSPIKSLVTSAPSSSEISLECDENLFEEFIKDDDIPMNKRTPVSSSTVTQNNTESGKDVLSSLDLIKQTSQDTQQDSKSDITHAGHSLHELNKNNDETGQLLENTSTRTGDDATRTFDLSPLVNELISSSPFVDDNKELEDIVPLNVTQTNTVVTGNNVSDLYVGELPVLDICSSDLNDLSSSSNVSDAATNEKENVLKQLDTTGDLLEQGKAETDIKKNADNLKTDSKQDFAEMKKDAQIKESDTKQQAQSSSKSLDVTEQVKICSSSQSTVDTARFDQKDRLNDKPEDNIVETDGSVETSEKQKLLKYFEQETSRFRDDVLKNERNLNSTSQSKNNDAISVETDPASEEPQDTDRNKQFSESCRGTNISNKNNEDKQQLPRSSLEREIKNPKHTVDARGEDINNEMLKSSTQEDDDTSSEVLDKISNAKITQASKTEEVIQEQSSKDEDEKQENIDEQLSGSEIVSPEENLVRTSNRKRKAPPPRDLSQHPPGWVRSALQLLQKVSRFRGSSRSKTARSAASWFLKPVATSEAPGYYKVIKNPMDFGTIKTKLEASEYNIPADFHQDMLLVKSNCCKYNPPGHIVRKDCDEVFNFYEAEYERFIEKLDKIYLPTPKKQKSSPV